MKTYLESQNFPAPVLIVDDNSLNMVAISNSLLKLGIDSDSVTNGQKAIDIVIQRFQKTGTTYRLILMDYSMPIMTGIEAGVKIKEFLSQ